MSDLALWGGISLRFERGAADYQDPVISERRSEVADKGALLLCRDMLDDIESVNSVISVRQRPRQNVVDLGRERPFGRLPASNIIDEDWVEIIRGDGFYFLLHDPGSKGVAAADLCHRVVAA